MPDPVLKLGGSYVTNYWLVPPEHEGWELSRSAYGGMATFSFSLFDPTRALNPVGLSEILVEENGDAGTRYWGGLLVEVVATTRGVGLTYDCKGLGWEFDLRRSTVTAVYRGISDQAVLTVATAIPPNPANIFLEAEKDLSSYTVTTTNILLGDDNIDKVVYQAQPIADILDAMAEYAGHVWGVTPLKVIYYRKVGFLSNGFSLSDAPDNVSSFGYYNFKRMIDATNVVNKVVVVGGYATLLDEVGAYSADGIQTLFDLGRSWHASEGETTITVETNTGSDGTPVWTAATVGTQRQSGTFDVIWGELDKTLKFASAPPNFATNSFRVSGDVWQPLRWEAVLDSSVEELGTEYELVITDLTLKTEEAVEKRASAELLQRALELEKINLTINHDGIEEGKTILLTNTVHGLAAVSYLVMQITMRPLGGTLFEYDLLLQRVPEDQL